MTLARMTSTIHFDRRVKMFSALAAAVLALAPLHEGRAQDNTQSRKERIGVYDSRAIAVAFAGSAAHERQLKELRAAHEKARDSGDTKEMARLESIGKEWQKKAHQQAFSTAPVDDLLAHITNALPGIRRTNNVSVIISKWDEIELKMHPRDEIVDVTEFMVDAFHPTERQRRSALEIRKHKPISLKQAGNLKD